ncbi:hypothetical protein [Sphingopyxis sp. GW247-27LB]|jgi:hypothetical protein|nr:hypothetical protein [Sphingopyxis sp. GW247-27LB]
MKVYEHIDDVAIDLGAITEETQGIGGLGRLDEETGDRYVFAGILSDD